VSPGDVYIDTFTFPASAFNQDWIAHSIVFSDIFNQIELESMIESISTREMLDYAQ
jgi:hypothetical protein